MMGWKQLTRVTPLLASVALAGFANADEERTTFTDKDNRFTIEAPAGWSEVDSSSKLAWHAASKGGTQYPSCSVKVGKEDVFSRLTAAEYIERRTKRKVKHILSISYTDVELQRWNRDFRFAGQRWLHYVGRGENDGFTIMSVSMETVKFGWFYSIMCKATKKQFRDAYRDFLTVAESFSFLDAEV